MKAIEDRALGALLGLATGDALGTTLEFAPRDTYPPLTGLAGGGPFGLEPGQWTDDTAMALALADSLARPEGFEEQDLLTRFVDWWRNGAYSCTGRCFDIGITTRQALLRWLAAKEPHCGATAPDTAGNGSLMRLAPVAIRFWNNGESLADTAARQSKTTHAAPEAVAACVAFADILAGAIAGKPAAEVLSPRIGNYPSAIAAIVGGSWRDKERAEIRSTGYVVHSLEAAMWCTGRSASFRQAVLLAANLGHDADTTAAITGQLAGALHGASTIPGDWLARLAWRERIVNAAAQLFRQSLAQNQGLDTLG